MTLRAGKPSPRAAHAGQHHAGDCRMTSCDTKPVTTAQACRLLEGGHVSACGVCRAHSAFGILD
ncbi:DUF6233 domain-containing protein [Streptomyces sp. NPDC058084]|uniref:DUF6233 domain-containing protein n=1 Tax=Streptomyces sp. NPDC058084 TaxID=3346333 RepID=UPI0036E2BA73